MEDIQNVGNGEVDGNSVTENPRYERTDSFESRFIMYTTSPSPLDEGNCIKF